MSHKASEVSVPVAEYLQYLVICDDSMHHTPKEYMRDDAAAD